MPSSGSSHRSVQVSELDLRIDATLRECWSKMRIESSPCLNFEYVHGKFEQVLAGDRPDLTLARCDALHAMLANSPGFEASGDGINVRRVLDLAASAGKTIAHDDYLNHEQDIEDAFLAALADPDVCPLSATARDGSA